MKKIAIGIPSKVDISPCFLRMLSRLYFTDAKIDDVIVSTAKTIADAREDITNNAIARDYDYILFIDTDIHFNSFDFARLYATMLESNADVVTGVYWLKKTNSLPVIYDTMEVYEHGSIISHAIPSNKPFEVQACGLGFALINLRTCKSIKAKYGSCFTNIEHLGEDLSFCKRVNDIGGKIVAEPSVSLGHELNGYIYTAKDGAQCTRRCD